jgi:hypothetical protein
VETDKLARGCDQAQGDGDTMIHLNSPAAAAYGRRQEGAHRGLKKGSINQRIGFRLGSGWIHHSSHLEVELWTLGIGLSDTRVEDVLGLIDLRTDRRS